MRLRQTEILGVRVDALTYSQTLELIAGLLLDSPNQHHITTVNAEFIMATLASPRFRDILNASDLNTADGVGLLWAAKYLSLPLAEGVIKGGSVVKNLSLALSLVRRGRAIWQMVYSGASLVFWPPYCQKVLPARVSGADLVVDLCALAAKQGYKVFLLGGSKLDPNTPVRTEAALLQKFPALKLARHQGLPINDDGSYDELKNKEILKAINDFKADIVFVAFNHPKAQYWIDDNLQKMPSVRLAMGIGGSFEFISGDIRRAPKVLRVLGLEWLYRLGRQPQRLPRIFTAVFKLISAVMKYKIKHV